MSAYNESLDLMAFSQLFLSEDFTEIIFSECIERGCTGEKSMDTASIHHTSVSEESLTRRGLWKLFRLLIRIARENGGPMFLPSVMRHCIRQRLARRPTFMRAAVVRGGEQPRALASSSLRVGRGGVGVIPISGFSLPQLVQSVRSRLRTG